jgi:hypothetical protein
MTLGEFYAMMSSRDPAGHSKLPELPEERYHLTEKAKPRRKEPCRHPFDLAGLSWKASRMKEPPAIGVRVTYTCPKCDKELGSMSRRIKL